VVLGLVIGIVLGWGSVVVVQVNDRGSGPPGGGQTAGLPSREPDPSSHVVVPHAE
jgi:hypothetical protein